MVRLLVDVGNRNMKIGFMEEGQLSKFTFQNIFEVKENVDHSVEEVVEYEGKFYCMGKGHYDFEFNKTKKNFIPALLKSYAMKSEDKEVEIMMLAPAEQVAGLRDIFKEMLEGKTFDFKYKNKAKSFTVKRVGVIGEGFATFFTLPAEVRKNKNVGIIDLGGRTVNIATFKKGNLDILKSYNYGMLDLKTKLLEIERLNGTDIDLIEIEERIEAGKLQIEKNIADNFLNRLLNDVKMDKIKFDMYDWYVTGGGSLDIKDTILQNLKDVIMLEEPIFTNVEGMNNFAKAKWGEI